MNNLQTAKILLAYILTGEFSDQYDLDEDQVRRTCEVVDRIAQERAMVAMKVAEAPPIDPRDAFRPKGDPNMN